MDAVSAFSDYLSRLMDERGVKQVEIAEKTGLSKQLTSAIVNGKRTPPMTCLTHIAEVLRLNTDEWTMLHDLAAVAHLPMEAQPRFEFLVKRIDTIESRLKAAEARRPGIENE